MRVPRSGAGFPPSRALAVVAAVVMVVVTADVLAGGPLRNLDSHVFAAGLPSRSGVRHLFWRTVVNGGQYWLVGSLVALTAIAVAWRRRSIALLVRAGGWLVAAELVSRGAQTGFARTPPRTGQDTLFADGYLSFPSGHAANAAACLLVTATLAGASRAWTIAAHGLAAGVAVAVVALGYHWPTDAAAGWGLGVVLAYAGRALVLPRGAAPPSQAPHPHPAETTATTHETA